MKRPRLSRKGFTLTELLITMTIIALLAGVYTPRYRLARGKAAYSACQQNLQNIAKALQIYANDNNQVYPPALSNLLPNYLSVIPQCPNVLNADPYSPSYTKNDLPTTFTIYCSGPNHLDAVQVDNQPYYQFGIGLGP